MEQSRLLHHSLLCLWSFLEQWHAPEPNAWGRRLVLGIAAPLTRTGCARISTGLRISPSRAAGTTTPTITLSCYRSRKYTLARGLRQSGQPSDHQTRHARSLWAGSGVLNLGAGSQSCLGLKRTVQRLSSSSLSPLRLLLLGIAHLPSLLRVESKRVPPPRLASNPGTLASSQGAMYKLGGHFCGRTSENPVNAKFSLPHHPDVRRILRPRTRVNR
jgi:hypothetical protein